MPTTVLAVTGKFTHFGSYSGYDRLYYYLNQYMPVTLHRNTMKDWQLKLVKKMALRNYWSSRYGLYHNASHLFTEYEAFRAAKKIKPYCVHVSYLEDTLGFLADKKEELPCRLFATSHQPPEWWQMTHKNTATLKALDGMVVLSKAAQAFFEQLIPGKVAYIPHGIDTTFFNYELRKKNTSTKHVLFIGNWLRDFETFVRTIELLEEKAKGDFCYDIVYPGIPEIPANPLHRLLKYKNVNWYKNITDIQLKELYHQAALLFIPFINTTANNALLEAAACGTPILTSRLESITDCFGHDNIYAVENNNIETFISCINHIADDKNYDEINSKTMQLRKYTEQHLDWKIIAQRHQCFFESCLK